MKRGETKDDFGMRQYVSANDDGVRLADMDGEKGYAPRNAKEGLRTATRKVRADGSADPRAKAHGVERNGSASDTEVPNDSFLTK